MDERKMEGLMNNPKKLTEILLQKCSDAKDRFFDARERDITYDFFEAVKPYADETRTEIEIWRQQVEAFIHEQQPKNLYMQQIDYAIEAMEQFIVQSFYQKTSKKRFLQSIQSVQYTLTIVLRKLEEAIGDDNEKTIDK